MLVKIVSLSKTHFEDEATSVTCPGSDGVFTLLSNHTDFAATLKEGVITLLQDGSSLSYEILGGVCVVRDGVTSLLVAEK